MGCNAAEIRNVFEKVAEKKDETKLSVVVFSYVRGFELTKLILK